MNLDNFNFAEAVKEVEKLYVPLTREQVSGEEPIVRNAVRCGICGIPADRYANLYLCQANPCHQGDLIVGIFSDLTPPF